MHQTLRLAADRFVEATEKLPPSILQPLLGSRWNFHDAVLHHHHQIEDDHIYPALLAVRPDLKSLVADLAQEHLTLNSAISAVDGAVSAFEKDPRQTQQEALHQAVVAFRDAFFPHLDVEDTEVVPAIAESMPADEWGRLDRQALRTIPRQYLSRAVGALDEVIQRLPDAERPPPPPPPIRLMLAVSWRKKWATWVKPLLV